MEMLTEKELAERLNVSCWAVRNWRINLGLPYIRLSRRIFYKLVTVKDWLDSFEKRNTPIA